MTGPHRSTQPPLMGVALVIAAAVIGFEMVLLRLLLMASWHHFAFIVISIALLGLGASGTALGLCRRWLLRHGPAALLGMVLITGLAMPACAALAQQLPIEARFLPALLWRQAGAWILYWLVLALPLFCGACAIGLTLMLAEGDVARVYAGNLIGSAVGALLAPLAMSWLPPAWLPTAAGLVTCLAAAWLVPWRTRRGLLSGGLAAALWALWLAMGPPAVRLDPFKYGAQVQRLQAQGQATRVAGARGPRAYLEAYAGAVFHDMAFLTGGKAPPPITVLVSDGHLAGSLLQVEGADQAAVLEGRIMSCVYDLAAPAPRVLLLGETDGLNALLAARHGARGIDMVQPDANVFRLLESLADRGGRAVLQIPELTRVVAEPRHFVERIEQSYDVIQLVSLEALPAGAGGVAGLGQNDLLTVQGLSACVGRLGPAGILTVTRGVQDPPRDNLKILATAVAALRRAGIERPAEHVVVLRDFLAVCTLLRSTPWGPEEVAAVRRLCAERGLTPVWFPGVTSGELNHPDAFASPPDGVGDWYHYAARRLFDPAEAPGFLEAWPFDIRPPTDDRPFFQDFCRLRSLARLRAVYGELWPTRGELAFVFVLCVIAVIAVLAVLLTIGPLLCLPSTRGLPGRARTVAYFGAVGLGYLMLEMTLLSRLTRWIGDPVTAAAVTIGGFLLFSGVGAWWAQRVGPRLGDRLPAIIAVLLLVGVLEIVGLGRLASVLAWWPLPLRCLAALVALAPLAVLLGLPTPAALMRLETGQPALIPWAWGINGCASVLAAPLATAVGMTWGFSVAGGLGLLMYLVPAALIGRFPWTPPASPSSGPRPPLASAG